MFFSFVFGCLGREWRGVFRGGLGKEGNRSFFFFRRVFWRCFFVVFWRKVGLFCFLLRIERLLVKFFECGLCWN